MNRVWILADEDFDSIMNQEGDWYDFLSENGIFNEKDSEEWFMNLRFEAYTDGWGGICPYCNKDVMFYELSGDAHRLKCKKCGTKSTITSRTWMDGTKMPLTHWRRVAWLLGQGLKISSHWLAGHLDISQKSAYYMLCTIAEATKTRPIKTPLRVNLSAYEIEMCLLQVSQNLRQTLVQKNVIQPIVRELILSAPDLPLIKIAA